MQEVQDAFSEVVAEAVRLIERNEVQRQPQVHMEGTYFSARVPGDEWIYWNDTSLNIYNKIRAITHPGPGARTLLGHGTQIVWEAYYDKGWPKYIATPGEVVEVLPGKGVKVKTGDSVLLLTRVQSEGESEPEQTPKFRIGTRFGINLTEDVYRLQRDVEDLRKLVGSK